MAGRKRTSRKVDLRKAFEMSGCKRTYRWFVNNKVVPVIGNSALHLTSGEIGKLNAEYKVTSRNFNRVLSSLDIPKDVIKLRKAVSKADPSVTAKVILDLLEKTSQPDRGSFDVSIRIPLHPISHNMLYQSRGGRLCRSKSYTKWRNQFFTMIRSIKPTVGKKFSFNKNMEVHLKFGHVESSGDGKFFDMQNFAKAAIDCTYEHFGKDDHLISRLSMDRELVGDYIDGYMEIKIKNIKDL